MLKRLDSFFIQVVAPNFFFISFDRTFPPGSQIHATTSLSCLAPFGFAAFPTNPPPFARASIVSFTEHLSGGGESQPVLLSIDQNALSIANCARIKFRLTAGRADAKALINIYTF